MTPDPSGGLARQIHRVARSLASDDPTDGQLLDRFLGRRDEAAFAVLVRRHGPMVLGVCRRILRNHADADDAFQAAFVVLVRKAGSLAPRRTVGDWLYGVAYHTAIKARAGAAKRRQKEARAAVSPEVMPAREPDGQLERLELLDRELTRLPGKYREPVVLCELEGRPRAEVAGLLGIPEGTLSSRLAHARKVLAERLRRRGAALPSIVAVAARLPDALAETTTRQAATGVVPAAVLELSRRGTRIMILTQWAAGLAAVVAVACGIAATTGGSPVLPADPPHEKPPREKVEDGVYLLLPEGSEGRKVILTSGSDAVLGKWLSPSIGTGRGLQSVTNHNTRFVFKVNDLGPLPKEATEVQTALVLDGVVFHLGRPEKLKDDRTANTWANAYSAAAGRTVAAKYKIEPQLRKHPGHRYEVRWTPGKEQYAVGEAVTLKMEIKNTGTGPFRFTQGGQQRGARDNQFRFIAQAGGKGVPDTGDPNNHGGKIRSITLKPGETFAMDVDVTKWFKFTEANTYRITGVFEMPVIDANSTDGFDPVVWDDLAVGDCDVDIVKK